MKKVILSLLTILLFSGLAQAQTIATEKKIVDLSSRPADHLMIQFGSDSWVGAPDSVKTSGMGRHFNIYFMLDKPFRTNNKFSLAYGVGFGTNNQYIDKRTIVDLSQVGNSIRFKQLDSLANRYDKQKVATVYLQVPAEIRYYSNPANPAKSWKLAAGVKVGLLFKGYTKMKDYQTASGNSFYGKTYVQKVSNKRFFTSNDVTLTARAGYGILSLNVGYTVTPVIRDGYGPSFNRLSVGLSISGL
ncbi:MAG: outer membrane beta-barrel protein [Sediminibacterium sp.]